MQTDDRVSSLHQEEKGRSMSTRQTKVARKCASKWGTTSGFRIIRVFSVEHNALRLQAHVKKLMRRMTLQPGAARIRLRVNRIRCQKESPVSSTAT